jgi:hypothetical protein
MHTITKLFRILFLMSCLMARDALSLPLQQIDQSNTAFLNYHEVIGTNSNPSILVQEFVASFNKINYVELNIKAQPQFQSGSLRIVIRNGSEVIASEFFQASHPNCFYDDNNQLSCLGRGGQGGAVKFSFANPITLIPGRVYQLEIYAFSVINLGFSASTGYPQGNLIINSLPNDQDLWFRTGYVLSPEYHFAHHYKISGKVEQVFKIAGTEMTAPLMVGKPYTGVISLPGSAIQGRMGDSGQEFITSNSSRVEINIDDQYLIAQGWQVVAADNYLTNNIPSDIVGAVFSTPTYSQFSLGKQRNDIKFLFMDATARAISNSHYPFPVDVGSFGDKFLTIEAIDQFTQNADGSQTLLKGYIAKLSIDSIQYVTNSGPNLNFDAINKGSKVTLNNAFIDNFVNPLDVEWRIDGHFLSANNPAETNFQLGQKTNILHRVGNADFKLNQIQSLQVEDCASTIVPHQVLQLEDNNGDGAEDYWLYNPKTIKVYTQANKSAYAQLLVKGRPYQLKELQARLAILEAGAPGSSLEISASYFTADANLEHNSKYAHKLLAKISNAQAKSQGQFSVNHGHFSQLTSPYIRIIITSDAPANDPLILDAEALKSLFFLAHPEDSTEFGASCSNGSSSSEATSSSVSSQSSSFALSSVQPSSSSHSSSSIESSMSSISNSSMGSSFSVATSFSSSAISSSSFSSWSSIPSSAPISSSSQSSSSSVSSIALAECSLKVTANSSTGYFAEVRIKNISQQVIQPWQVKVAFGTPARLRTAWSVQVSQPTTAGFTASSLTSNQKILPGQQAVFRYFANKLTNVTPMASVSGTICR